MKNEETTYDKNLSFPSDVDGKHIDVKQKTYGSII